MKLLVILLVLLSVSSWCDDKQKPVENTPENNQAPIEKKDVAISSEKVFAESLDLLDELIAILENAGEDEKAAINKILKLEVKALTIRRKFNTTGLNKLNEEKKKELSGKFQKRINASSLRLLNAIQIIKDKKELSETVKNMLSKIQ